MLSLQGMVGKGMVAVKKLSNTFVLHENKFHEEVRCLLNAKHKNIVRFLGYCAETQGKMQKFEGKLVMADQRNWLLCFEYVCKGSLDKHITGRTKTTIPIFIYFVKGYLNTYSSMFFPHYT
jgi:hypothetical protein